MYFLWWWSVKVRVRWVRPKGLCGRCLLRVTSICMTSSRYVCLRGQTRPEHALVIQGGSLGGVGMVE